MIPSPPSPLLSLPPIRRAACPSSRRGRSRCPVDSTNTGATAGRAQIGARQSTETALDIEQKLHLLIDRPPCNQLLILLATNDVL
ncbi:hypothetical protein ACP70R_004856 [Stipagrostis hirtigluma subsp. patula]